MEDRPPPRRRPPDQSDLSHRRIDRVSAKYGFPWGAAKLQLAGWQTARDNHRAQAVYGRVGATRDDRLLYYDLPVQPV